MQSGKSGGWLEEVRRRRKRKWRESNTGVRSFLSPTSREFWLFIPQALRLNVCPSLQIQLHVMALNYKNQYMSRRVLITLFIPPIFQAVNQRDWIFFLSPPLWFSPLVSSIPVVRVSRKGSAKLSLNHRYLLFKFSHRLTLEPSRHVCFVAHLKKNISGA